MCSLPDSFPRASQELHLPSTSVLEYDVSLSKLYQVCSQFLRGFISHAKRDQSFPIGLSPHISGDNAHRQDVSTRSKSILERIYQSLKLWADGNGVENGDLDVRLKLSTDLKIEVGQLLLSIGKSLAYGEHFENLHDALPYIR